MTLPNSFGRHVEGLGDLFDRVHSSVTNCKFVGRSSKCKFSATIHVTLPNSFGRHVELLGDLLYPVLYDYESLLGDLQNM